MTIIEQKLIDAYTVLVLAEKKTINDVPERLRQAVEIKVAERTIEVLGGVENGI